MNAQSNSTLLWPKQKILLKNEFQESVKQIVWEKWLHLKYHWSIILKTIYYLKIKMILNVFLGFFPYKKHLILLVSNVSPVVNYNTINFLFINYTILYNCYLINVNNYYFYNFIQDKQKVWVSRGGGVI